MKLSKLKVMMCEWQDGLSFSTRECFLGRPNDGPIGEATVAFLVWRCRGRSHVTATSNLYTCLVTDRISLLNTNRLNRFAHHSHYTHILSPPSWVPIDDGSK